MLDQNDTLGDTPIIVGEKGQPTSKHVITVKVGQDQSAPYMISKRFNLHNDFWVEAQPTLRSVNPDVAVPQGQVDLEAKTFTVHGMSYGFTHILLTAGDQTIVYYVTVIPDTPEAKVAPMVSSGKSHVLALRDDATVWAWGSNVYGQLGQNKDPEAPYSALPVQVTFPGLGERDYITMVSAGEHHSAAPTHDGHLYTWGSNTDEDGALIGQLGLKLSLNLGEGSKEPVFVTTPTKVKLSNTASGADARIAKVVTGILHTAVLTESGRVYTWGDNQYGQLGIGVSTNSIKHSSEPKLVNGMSKVIDIAEGARGDSIHVVRYDGTLWGWGKNNNAQIHSTSIQDFYNAPVISKLDFSHLTNADGTTGLPKGVQIIKIYDGKDHTLAMLNNGPLIAWGNNSLSQLGTGVPGTAATEGG